MSKTSSKFFERNGWLLLPFRDEVSEPILAKLLIPESIYHWTEKSWDDVDQKKINITDLQAIHREQLYELGLHGRHDKRQHAQQQLNPVEQNCVTGLLGQHLVSGGRTGCQHDLTVRIKQSQEDKREIHTIKHEVLVIDRAVSE